MPGDVIPGPWPGSGQPAPPPAPVPAPDSEALSFSWLSQTSTTEDRRHSILASKPACKACGVPWAREYRKHPPLDGLCRACRDDLARNTDPDDPDLF